MGFGAISIKGRALRYLSQREHSRAELERKLSGRVQDTTDAELATAKAQIAAALDDLAAKGLLSETRTAESVLNSHARRYGVRRLKQTLQLKGLAPELVASTLQRARSTELERAMDLWRRRFGAPAADATERARQMRFLAGRGFEGDVIRRVVRGAEDEPSI